MTKKTQAQTPPNGTNKSPEEIAQAFLQLWQEKWNDTLQKKGWPQGAAMPELGQMPFFNPFMPMNGFAAPAADDAALKKLEMRVAALEKKLAIKQDPPKTPPKASKAKKYAKAKKS